MNISGATASVFAKFSIDARSRSVGSCHCQAMVCRAQSRTLIDASVFKQDDTVIKTSDLVRDSAFCTFTAPSQAWWTIPDDNAECRERSANSSALETFHGYTNVAREDHALPSLLRTFPSGRFAVVSTSGSGCLVSRAILPSRMWMIRVA